MFSGGDNNNAQCSLIGLGMSMAERLPVNPALDLAIDFAQVALASTNAACGGSEPTRPSVQDNAAATVANIVASQTPPPPQLGISSYRSDATPSCRAVEEGYSWKVGDDKYEIDNVSIYNLGNPSFSVISSLFLRDKYEEAGMSTSTISRWVIT